ncbi:amidohydrolase, imidazolonepropionase [Thermaerobacter subterraneus DSM 13965]|uniref:Imidazolonepropionase n=1 Tax=Thermaerobacter subterraneus DSM 13965 TaxID=867903 RepID=K6PZX6_9FIRM|nr:amidohydrolase, imidazolonepropionase [Thermaerobacter subterraneus DSM 13965]
MRLACDQGCAAASDQAWVPACDQAWAPAGQRRPVRVVRSLVEAPAVLLLPPGRTGNASQRNVGHKGAMVVRQPREPVDLLVGPAAQVATPVGTGCPPAGPEQGRLQVIPEGAVAVRDGRIVAVGPYADLARRFDPAEVLDASGCTVLPGFVDPHTHLCFAGWRAEEFERRLAGASYQEILAAGGGILDTVRKTRTASEVELAVALRRRLLEVLRMGTTTVEVKSGYGLTTADELKMLRAIRRAADPADDLDGTWPLGGGAGEPAHGPRLRTNRPGATGSGGPGRGSDVHAGDGAAGAGFTGGGTAGRGAAAGTAGAAATWTAAGPGHARPTTGTPRARAAAGSAAPVAAPAAGPVAAGPAAARVPGTGCAGGLVLPEVVATFLGAHAVPPEYRGRPDEYVDRIVEEMLPAVAREGLAEYADVFCEQGVFDLEQTRRIVEAARRLGFRIRLHVDELTPLGGAGLAAEVGAVSADHLLHVRDEDIPRLREAGTIATLLPGTAFFLREPYAPARKLIEAGVPVALATDYNPGSHPAGSMPLVMAIACVGMGMTPAEALVASTLGGAWAVERARRLGSLEPGKQADLVVIEASSYQHLAYRLGTVPVVAVVKAGRVVGV